MRPAPPYHPPQGPLEVLYVDEDILVIDKPSGLLSVPGRDPKHADSVALRAEGEHPGARIVHRLDMDTSGVMVLARHAFALRDVSGQFERRKTQKSYLAVVAGALPDDEGEVDAPLICDWPNRPKQIVDHDQGKRALTRWKVLRSGDVSYVELTPETGRTHQLRVHMAHIGCPILGDPFYAPGDIQNAASRLMLHAHKLTIAHPMTGLPHCFIAPAPRGFS